MVRDQFYSEPLRSDWATCRAVSCLALCVHSGDSTNIHCDTHPPTATAKLNLCLRDREGFVVSHHRILGSSILSYWSTTVPGCRATDGS